MNQEQRKQIEEAATPLNFTDMSKWKYLVEDKATEFCWGDDTNPFQPYVREFGVAAFTAGADFARSVMQYQISERDQKIGFLRGENELLKRADKNKPQSQQATACVDCKMANFCILRHHCDEDKLKYCIKRESDMSENELFDETTRLQHDVSDILVALERLVRGIEKASMASVTEVKEPYNAAREIIKLYDD